MSDIEGFVTGQTPFHATPLPLAPSSQAIGYQLGNIYLLLMCLGVGVMYATSEPKVLRNYLIVLGIFDLTHIYAVSLGLGWDGFMNVWNWNALTWGNIVVTGLLFCSRVAYLAGYMGEPRKPNEKRKVKL